MKTNELTGAALDWAVAKCEGNTFAGDYPHLLSAGFRPPKYSTDWAQGGPIIEREGITVSKTRHGFWESHLRTYDERENYQTGPTPLIAAMRCYVVSKLGDEVDVPDELFKENDHA